MPRLSKFLSDAGIASRRGADALIAAGRVRINGETVVEPGRPVDSGDTVEFDGKPVRVSAAPKRYILLNKPRGYVTSNADAHADKLARELIPDSGRLFAVGRLDKNSEGLLLFTDDGDLACRLTHPRYEVHKLYLVTTARVLPPGALEKLRAGIDDAGERLEAVSIVPLGECKFQFELKEGKNREIRRMLAAVGARVSRLRRIALGTLRLGTLPVGVCRDLTAEEVRLLSASAQSAQPPPPPRSVPATRP